MKTTLEIDDELYREAKAVASLTGRKMKDLVTEGLRWAIHPESRVARSRSKAAALRKLASCFAEADNAIKAARRGPPAREELSKDRNRLAQS
jgi:Bacterial antitoxin of type II TA system, VapB